MPKPIPWPYQQNSKRLWMPWMVGWRVKDRLPNRFWMPRQHAWELPNTRRWRKIVREVLGREEDCWKGNPPPPWSSYSYTSYGVSLSGRGAPTKPAWQDWPRRRGPGHDLCWDPAAPLVGGIREAVQQRDFAAGEMMGILEKDREEVEKHAQSTAGGTAALLSRLRGG